MKKTLTSLALLTALGSSDVQASEALFNVSQEIHQEANLMFTQKKESSKVRFEKLTEFAEQIQTLNQWLNGRQNLTQSELSVLSIVNGVLDFTFHQFKNKYEKLIYASYMQEFRKFSSQRSLFKSYLKQLHDQIQGIRIVEVEGLALNPNDVMLINQHAKAFEEKLLNAS